MGNSNGSITNLCFYDNSKIYIDALCPLKDPFIPIFAKRFLESHKWV